MTDSEVEAKFRSLARRRALAAPDRSTARSAVATRGREGHRRDSAADGDLEQNEHINSKTRRQRGSPWRPLRLCVGDFLKTGGTTWDNSTEKDGAHHRRRRHERHRPRVRAQARGAGRGHRASPISSASRRTCRRRRSRRSWRSIDSVAEEVEALGRRCLKIWCDLTVSAQIEDMARRAAEHYGHIDILVNNARAIIGRDRVPVTELARRGVGALPARSTRPRCSSSRSSSAGSWSRRATAGASSTWRPTRRSAAGPTWRRTRLRNSP